jgi:hypothetical protein
MKMTPSTLASITFALTSVWFTHSSIAASPAPTSSAGSSDYFRDNAAGFIVERKERGAPEIVRYGMAFILTRRIVQTLYVRTRFENPADPSHPLIVDAVLRPGVERFGVQSRPVYGLKTGQKYKVEILVFDSPKRTHEISRHVTYSEFL